jgi:hypothetical protein
VIRLALIGCGKWGKNYLKSIDSINGVNITTICDPLLKNTDPDIGAYGNYTDVRDVDGAIVATPPDSHKQIVNYFLDIGVPVLVEKPVTLSLLDANEIFEKSLATGIPVLVNNIHLFSSAFETLRQDVRKWREPLSISSIGGNAGPYRKYSALYDYGPHDLSMCLSLFTDYPDNIEIIRGGSGRGEIYTIRLKQGKNQASLTIGNGFIKKDRRFRVTSKSHKAIYDDLAENKLALDGMVCPIDTTPPLTRVILIFVKYIKDKNIDWRFDCTLNQYIMGVLEECRVKLLSKYPDLHEKLNFGLPSFHSIQKTLL